MIENGIYDGDIAIIKKTNDVQNGKIAAVLTLENEVTLKKIKIQNISSNVSKEYTSESKVKIFIKPESGNIFVNENNIWLF